MASAAAVGLFDLAGLDLSFLRIDHQVRLHLGQTEVVIEAAFHFKVLDFEYAMDPADRSQLGPLLDVYPDQLESAEIDAGGTLRLSFARGGQIRVPPDPMYEAWQIVGPGTRLIVCPPGGERLAVWR